MQNLLPLLLPVRKWTEASWKLRERERELLTNCPEKFNDRILEALFPSLDSILYLKFGQFCWCWGRQKGKRKVSGVSTSKPSFFAEFVILIWFMSLSLSFFLLGRLFLFVLSNGHRRRRPSASFGTFLYFCYLLKLSLKLKLKWREKEENFVCPTLFDCQMPESLISEKSSWNLVWNRPTLKSSAAVEFSLLSFWWSSLFLSFFYFKGRQNLKFKCSLSVFSYSIFLPSLRLSSIWTADIRFDFFLSASM